MEAAHLPWWYNPQTVCLKECATTSGCFLRHKKLAGSGTNQFGDAELLRWVLFAGGYLLELMSLLKQATLAELVEYVTGNELWVQDPTFAIQDTRTPLLKAMCVVNGWDLTHYDNIRPPLAPTSVLIWRITSSLLQHLTEDGRERLRKCETLAVASGGILRQVKTTEAEAWCRVGLQTLQQSSILMDSHVHLTSTLTAHKLSPKANIEALRDSPYRVDATEFTPRLELLNNCVFPAEWKHALSTPPGQWFSVGIHPRMAGSLVPPPGLEAMARHPCCAAIGECGINVEKETSSQDLDRQLKCFNGQLLLAGQLQKPVVLHLRVDIATERASWTSRVREMVSQTMGTKAKIQLHCYTGDISEVWKWINMVASTYFGIGGLLLSNRPRDQRMVAGLEEAVRRMPLNRLLLESDSPHLLPQPLWQGGRRKPNNPWCAMVVAERVAELRNLPLWAILEVTRQNAYDFLGC